MTKIRRSSLFAAFENLSPNCTRPRKLPVRRLTPHCMAGNLTAERCLSLSRFKEYDAKDGASCNYSIGSIGRIGLGVPESFRPWTSSSPTNDHQAITFEIANNGGAPDWRMSDQAINAWLDLSVEICEFYGFKKVNYQPKPDHIKGAEAVEAWIATWAKDDEMIITLHRWYKAKECPGTYFMRQLPWLVREMNRRLAGAFPEKFVGEGASTTLLKKGSEGAEVRVLQELLNRHGASPELDVDGDFGGLTEAALLAFQQKHGIAATGTVLKDTWDVLIKDPVSVSPPPPPPPKEEPVLFKVRITAKSLNVRKGPSVDHEVAMILVNDRDLYSIVEEATAHDGGKWGRLKSGAGWINLRYTRRI